MSKKVLIVKSSPRAGSNSSTLADRVHAGAVKAGAQVDMFSLHDMDIRPCDVCEDCRDTGGVCVIKDDMQKLYPKIGRQMRLCLPRQFTGSPSALN